MHIGTYDNEPKVKRLEAINFVLAMYFGTAKWIRRRKSRQPGFG